jgi:hypothetical protein
MAYPFPALDAATVASGMRWLMAMVALLAVAWLASLLLRRGGAAAEPDAPLTVRK